MIIVDIRVGIYVIPNNKFIVINFENHSEIWFYILCDGLLRDFRSIVFEVWRMEKGIIKKNSLNVRSGKSLNLYILQNDVLISS